MAILLSQPHRPEYKPKPFAPLPPPSLPPHLFPPRLPYESSSELSDTEEADVLPFPPLLFRPVRRLIRGLLYFVSEQPDIGEAELSPSHLFLPRTLPPSLPPRPPSPSPSQYFSDQSDIEEAEAPHFSTYDDLLSKQKAKLDADFTSMEKKIHQFPRSLSSLYVRYGNPVAVPIGCHKDISKFEMLIKVKHVATHLFRLNTAFRSFGEMYEAFSSAVGDVRSLYECPDRVLPKDDKMSKLDILYDGCFLLQYMLRFTSGPDSIQDTSQSLVCYFDSNHDTINRDMMLLENQLPWVVIQTLRGFIKRPVPVEEFIAKMGRTLQVRKGNDKESFKLDDSYTPPHLLGLLRFYKIGSNIAANKKKNEMCSLNNYCCYSNSGVPPSDGTRPISKTISAIELAEIGIKLTASKTTKFMDMGIKKGLFCNEIFLAPLLLDETRLCWLVNMATFEVCMATTFSSDTEKHAVCSYLVALAMLMDREEDVHELRSKGLIQGQLTNKETLDFFKGLVKHISGGLLYIHLMEEIEDYKLKRWMWIKVHKFIHNNYKTIAAVLSIIGVLVGIFKALFSLKQY